MLGAVLVVPDGTDTGTSEMPNPAREPQPSLKRNRSYLLSDEIGRFSTAGVAVSAKRAKLQPPSRLARGAPATVGHICAVPACLQSLLPRTLAAAIKAQLVELTFCNPFDSE